MINLRRIRFVFALGIVFALTSCCHAPCKHPALFQVSTIRALKQGDYNGRISLAGLKAKGNFGFGTFDGLDGEMIELDGKVYQANADGRVYLPPDDSKTPFAAVLFFTPDKSLKVEKCANYPELTKLIESQITDKEMIYAVRIEGEFAYLKLRAPRRQNKPYPPLEEALKSQSIFEHNNIQGTLVGFWFPAYLSEVNSSGIHFHFLSADKRFAGHMLEGKFGRLKISLQRIDRFKALLGCAG